MRYILDFIKKFGGKFIYLILFFLMLWLPFLFKGKVKYNIVDERQ